MPFGRSGRTLTRTPKYQPPTTSADDHELANDSQDPIPYRVGQVEANNTRVSDTGARKARLGRNGPAFGEVPGLVQFSSLYETALQSVLPSGSPTGHDISNRLSHCPLTTNRPFHCPLTTNNNGDKMWSAARYLHWRESPSTI